MTDEVPVQKVNYQGASKNPKVPAAETLTEAVEKRLKKIDGVTIIETKPSLGKRFRSVFGGQDLKTVGKYLLLDVVVPSGRDLLFDLIKEGGHRAIYGDSPRRSSPISSIIGGHRVGQTNYSSISSPTLSGNRRQGDTNIVQTQNPRSQFDFSGLVITDRVKVQEILEGMTDAIEEYGVVTVADFYDIIGMSGNGFTDRSFGWDAALFGTADVKKVREGYILDMAPPRGIK